MSMMHTGLSEYDISGEEIGVLVSGAHITNTKFNVYIPKLMPLISRGTGNINKVFNKNIFVNDSGCSVSPSNSVSTRGYLTIGRHDSCYLSNNGNGISAGTMVKIQVMGGSVDNMLIMDNGGMS